MRRIRSHPRRQILICVPINTNNSTGRVIFFDMRESGSLLNDFSQCEWTVDRTFRGNINFHKLSVWKILDIFRCFKFDYVSEIIHI